MGDGATGTRSIPFTNYMIGLPNAVYYHRATDCTGITKDMQYCTSRGSTLPSGTSWPCYVVGQARFDTPSLFWQFFFAHEKNLPLLRPNLPLFHP